MKNTTNKTYNRRTLEAAIKAAGITGYEITGAGQSLEVCLPDDKAERTFHKKVATWGGYRTGAGQWYLQASAAPDKGDYNAPSSAWHY